MRVQIQDYRTIQKAALAFPLICVVQGPNRSGKSSVIGAVRACLTKNPMPDFGYHNFKMTKKELKSLVRDSERVGSATMGTDKNNKITVVWPDGAVDSFGKVPFASAVAAGSFSQSIAAMDKSARGAALATMMVREIERADLDEGLEGIPEKVRDKIWETYEKTPSMDTMHKHAEDKLRDLKREWQEITGVNFGTKVMTQWEPIGWDGNLAAMSIEEARAAVSVAEEAAKALAADVSAAELSQLFEEASFLKRRREILVEKDQAIVETKAALETAREYRANLPAAEAMVPVQCPDCKAAIYAIDEGGGKLRLVTAEDGLSPEEILARGDAISVANRQISKLEGDLRTLDANRYTVDVEIKSSERAQARLDEIGDNVDAESMKVAANALALAQRNLALITQVTQATKKMATIETSMRIVDALSPEGIRRTIMTRNLDSFNETLGELSAHLKIPPVRIDMETVDVMVGDRSYRDESGSERLRARIALQLATAQLDGSDMVLIDDDVDQDTAYINALINTLIRIKMPAVISYHVENVKRALDVDNVKNQTIKDNVACYWLQDGIAMTMAAAKEAVGVSGT